ncbi:MAG: hypothetical protein WKF75_10160, partial [Singulisphaera sp.]
LGHDLGSLEPGKNADVVLVDLWRPHLYPLNMSVFRLVCFANGAHRVDPTWREGFHTKIFERTVNHGRI